jgi:transcriptional regulator with PAS, ATPase and Fis domain
VSSFAARPKIGVQLIGQSAVMVALQQEIDRVARSDAKVLITGESGVGKEIVARSIHMRGPRSANVFAPVNCAGLPETLLESELFGHVKGSFTGAYRDKPGKLESANNGTAFLDEIGEMTLRMQGLLLRFLETGELQKVGADNGGAHVNVRVIAATNRNLREMITQGTFREDLFYRLNVIHIVVPPLRERREDIPALVNHFRAQYAALNRSPITSVTPEAMKALTEYSWPGNVRELEHWIESEIHFAPPRATRLERLSRAPTVSEASRPTPALVRPLRDVEREVIVSALSAAGDDVSCAARELGISRGKLYRKLRQYGLDDAARDS